MEQALLVVNLAAGSVSKPLKQIIEKALAADLKLEVAETNHPRHATELAADAADRGFDLVIAFGGDGTMNEVVNGLAGTDTALTILPGGTANVLARSFGISRDIVEATGDLLNRVKTASTRKINIGRMDDGRYFVMSCGAGIDAATVKRVEANPDRKRKFADYYFFASVLREAVVEYRGRAPFIELEAGGIKTEVITGIVSNIPQFTFFKRWPVVVAPETRADGGFDVLGLARLKMRKIPRLVSSLFKTHSHLRWPETTYIHNVDSVTMRSTNGPFPVQVDGEFVGERRLVKVELVPDGLLVLD